MHLLRHEIREKKIHTQSRSSIDKNILEEIYIKGKLHPRLKHKKLSYLLIPFLTGISGVCDPIYSVLAGTGVGVGLTASAHFWSGILPRKTADIKWLRWALHWENPKNE